MATNFPTSLDTLTNPTSSDSLNSPSHSAQHANANDAIEALQAKVGVDSSAVTSSLDYKVAQLEAQGVYAAYTPTFTDVSFSSYTARYAIVNKLVHVWFSGILDAAVTGAIQISTPVATQPSNSQAIFGGSCYGIDDNTNATYFGMTVTRSDDTFRFYSSTVDGSSASANQWDATAPFTWASGDLLSFSVVVEAS